MPTNARCRTLLTPHGLLPNAPTMIEVGLPQATATVWYGLFGPAKLPPPVMERLRKEIMAVAKTPAVRDKMAAAGLQMAAVRRGVRKIGE